MKELVQKLHVTDYAYSEELEALNFDSYADWISKNLHAPLDYLSGERAEKRKNLKSFWPSCESFITFIFSYHDTKFSLLNYYKKNTDNNLKIASYSLGFQGEDYHFYLMEKLNEIGNYLKEKYDLEFQLALDIHPVLDRDLASRSGLGWYGKNSMLISKKHGSFTIIGSLLLSKKIPEMWPRAMEVDHCGQCRKCIDHCPTEAILENERKIISSRCISTFTIEEFKLDSVPDEKMDLSSGYIFGCDICQDVCPWNQRLMRQGLYQEVEFNQKQLEILEFFKVGSSKEVQNKIEGLSNGEYKKKFFKTSYFRSGKRGLLKNLIFYNKD